MTLKIKRIYEGKDEGDGIRILVDRLWPRGISKEKSKLDYWMKGVAPSNELRKGFNHNPGKFPEFRKKYIEELRTGKQNEELQKLKELIKAHENVTLIYAAKDEQHNQAVVLQEIIKDELG